MRNNIAIVPDRFPAKSGKIIVMILLTLLTVLPVPSSASEDEHKKVVYFNIDMNFGELKDDPFFSGLVIEENVETPALDFDYQVKGLPETEIDMEPGIRNKIISLKLENTFEPEVE